MEEIKPKSIFSIPHYKLLSAITLTALISWSAWLLVIYKLDPYEATSMALSLFFLSFTFSIAGTFTIILFFLKKKKTKNEIYIKHVMISLRQGILLGVCTSTCLLLLMFGMLRMWNGFLLVILIMLFEFYLSGKDELD